MPLTFSGHPLEVDNNMSDNARTQITREEVLGHLLDVGVDPDAEMVAGVHRRLADVDLRGVDRAVAVQAAFASNPQPLATSWSRIVEHFGLDDSFRYSQSDRDHYFNAYAEEALISSVFNEDELQLIAEALAGFLETKRQALQTATDLSFKVGNQTLGPDDFGIPKIESLLMRVTGEKGPAPVPADDTSTLDL
jgi:hypothetical protein